MEKIEEKAHPIFLEGIIMSVIWQFFAEIKTFEDIEDFMEIQHSFCIKHWDIKRLMLKGKLNEDKIRNAISDKDENQARLICSLFNTEKWIGRGSEGI